MNTNTKISLNSNDKKIAYTYAKDLINYIDASPCSFYAVKNSMALLDKKGFTTYKLSDINTLAPGSKGIYKHGSSALIAFTLPTKEFTHFNIFGAHTDSPALKVKPDPVINEEDVIKLSVEVYGGPLLSTWFDRPLSLAGRVLLNAQDKTVEERLIHIEEPILTIPSLAIHLNRDVNNGMKIEPQKHILPLFSTCSEDTVSKNYFVTYLSEKIGCDVDDILDFDLYTYETQKGCFTGAHNEFISVSRIDNLAMCHLGSKVLSECDPHEHAANIVILTDNEEVGSKTPEGADSLWIRSFLEALACSQGISNKAEFLNLLEHSFMISADATHAVHPNFQEKYDSNNRPHINMGPAIKSSASRSYATDAFSSAKFKLLAKKAGVPVQTFTNRADMRGGSTIGPITTSTLPVHTVDVGIPMWAMHSCREVCGTFDPYLLSKIVEIFFSE